MPRGALFDKDGKRVVYRWEGGGFAPVEVTVSRNSVSRVVVDKGLQAGRPHRAARPDAEGGGAGGRRARAGRARGGAPVIEVRESLASSVHQPAHARAALRPLRPRHHLRRGRGDRHALDRRGRGEGGARDHRRHGPAQRDRARQGLRPRRREAGDPAQERGPGPARRGGDPRRGAGRRARDRQDRGGRLEDAHRHRPRQAQGGRRVPRLPGAGAPAPARGPLLRPARRGDLRAGLRDRRRRPAGAVRLRRRPGPPAEDQRHLADRGRRARPARRAARGAGRHAGAPPKTTSTCP